MQKTIESVSVPGLAIWVKSTDGKTILAQSSQVSDEVMSIADMPLKPQVYPVGDRFLILYRGGVTVRGDSLGKVYMAQDVTQEQSQLMSAIQGLAAVCILSLLLTTIAIALQIRRSLQPLQEMSQMAERYSDRVIRVEATGNIEAIADRDRLKQVLINLIDNAVKYSDAEQPIILSIDRLDGQANNSGTRSRGGDSAPGSEPDF